MDDPLDLKLLMTPGQVFNTSENIIPSAVVSSSKNIFKCDSCDTFYTDKVYYDLHKQTHHQSKDYPLAHLMNSSAPHNIHQPLQGSTPVMLQDGHMNAQRRSYPTEAHQQVYGLAPPSQYQMFPQNSQSGAVPPTHSAQQSFAGNTFVVPPQNNHHFHQNTTEMMGQNQEVTKQEYARDSSSNDYILPCTSASTNNTNSDNNRRRNISYHNIRSRVVTNNNKVRPFKCDQCTASFLDKDELEEHQKKHTKDGPFTCDDCHFTFMYKSHYRSHKTRCMKKRSMMPSSSPKVICPQQVKHEFPTNNTPNMNHHQNNHLAQTNSKYGTPRAQMTSKTHGSTSQKNPFSRQKTQYEKFNPSNPSFKRVKKDSRVDRPYECNECDASFQSETDLSNHKVKHTGDGPFMCEQCKFVFLYRKLYEAHKRRCDKRRRDTESLKASTSSLAIPTPSSQYAQCEQQQPLHSQLMQQDIASTQPGPQLVTPVHPNVITGAMHLPGTTEQPTTLDVRPGIVQSCQGQQHMQSNMGMDHMLAPNSTMPNIMGGGRQDVKYEIVPLPTGLIDLSEGVINVNQIMNLIKVSKSSN